MILSGIVIVIIIVAFILAAICNNKVIEKNFQKLINSNRYKDSNHEIQKLNDHYYALRNKRNGQYVDLRTKGFEWGITSRYGDHCKGSKSAVIAAFEYKYPTIKPINIQKTF